MKSVKSLQQLGCLSRPELSVATPVGRPEFFPREKDLIRFVGYFQSSSVFGTSIGRPSLPKPKKGEVLVKVEAAGINAVDWKIQAGLLKHILPLKFPHIPGSNCMIQGP